MKPAACLLLYLILSNGLWAQRHQQANIDSLLSVLPHIKEDTNGVNVLNILSFSYQFIDPGKGILYGQRGLELSGKLKWKKGIGTLYNTLGLNYVIKADYPEALEYSLNALRIDEEIKDEKQESIVCANICNIYFFEKNFPLALKYGNRAIEIATAVNDKEALQYALGNAGPVYIYTGDANKALDYMFHSLQLATELGDVNQVTIQTSNIGDTYNAIKKYPEALQYGFMGLALATNSNDKTMTAMNLGDIGEVYLGIAKDSTHLYSDSLIPVKKTASIDLAINYLQQGIAASRKINYIDGIREFSQNLSEAYALSGNYKAALEAHLQYTDLKDSIFSAKNNIKVDSLEHSRTLELKDKDILIAKMEITQRRRESIFYIAGISVLVIIVILVYLSFRAQKVSNILLGKEKKRTDELLLNILPLEVAEELKDTGVSAARQYDDVSILFTDFVNFSGIAEKLTPQQLVKELNECFTVFDAIIERNAMERIKTIGDAYMAVCGLPVADPLHAQKTVQAALEICTYMAGRKADTFSGIRIGINSGSVVAGIVGVKKFAYDIWGDAVNTAARMEQNGAGGKVNISGSTHELVKDLFPCTYRGMIHAKNKGELSMYFIEAK